MRVVLAMSGGVDSSVAAYLLKQQGFEVVGLFMRSGVTEEVCAVDTGSGRRETSRSVPFQRRVRSRSCCSAADAADARRVADKLDIPFHAVDFSDGFAPIMDYFVDEYLAGRTPNPCILCNTWLKFGRLWEFARQVGAERIATGHYARLVPASEWARSLAPGRAAVSQDGAETDDTRPQSPDVPPAWTDTDFPALLRGRDPTKDQSYALFGIRRELLPRVLFPVGEFTKTQIRQLAHQLGLRVADKPDSQEICFVPDNDYSAFVRRRGGERDTSGEIVDTSGRVVGHHDGYERFTVGQRKGLGIAFGSPRYVVRIEPESRRVVVGTRDELARTWLEADRLNWLVDPVPDSFRCLAQIRYKHQAAPAVARRVGPDRLRVEFDQPQYGVAPGQAVVLYVGNRVVGGGWICSERG